MDLFCFAAQHCFCELRKLARYVGRYEISSSISSVLSAFCTLHRRWRCWRKLQTREKESIGLARDSMVLRRHGALFLEIGNVAMRKWLITMIL
jgi:hypothetical protein